LRHSKKICYLFLSLRPMSLDYQGLIINVRDSHILGRLSLGWVSINQSVSRHVMSYKVRAILNTRRRYRSLICQVRAISIQW
jgi:hypothetical protein